MPSELRFADQKRNEEEKKRRSTRHAAGSREPSIPGADRVFEFACASFRRRAKSPRRRARPPVRRTNEPGGGEERALCWLEKGLKLGNRNYKNHQGNRSHLASCGGEYTGEKNNQGLPGKQRKSPHLSSASGGFLFQAPRGPRRKGIARLPGLAAVLVRHLSRARRTAHSTWSFPTVDGCEILKSHHRSETHRNDSSPL